MKLRKSEVFAIVVTLMFAVLLIGYSVGKNEVSGKYKIETESPKHTAAVASEEIVSPAQEFNEAAAETEPAFSELQDAPSSGTSEDALININTASSQELQKLNGIGEVIAQRIIDYRSIAGGFDDISEIKEVSGIGDATFAKIEDKITVG